jgi:hypothetical protein
MLHKLKIEHQVYDEVKIGVGSSSYTAIVLKIEYAVYKKTYLINDNPDVRISHIETDFKGTFIFYTVSDAKGRTTRVLADRVSKSNNVTIIEED